MKRYLPFIIIVVVLLVAFGAVMFLLRSSQTAPETASRSAQAAANSANAGQPAGAASTPMPDGPPGPGASPTHLRGEATAPVLLEEFGDFQCPPCGLLYPELKKIEGEYGTRVRVIFREFPLAKIHKNALDAARAAEAAGFQGRFWEMHDMLYEKQGEWSVMPDARPIFQEFARVLKLDVARFQSDMDSLQVNSRISADMARGESLGVKGTPTIFINGRDVPAASLTADGLRSIINATPKEKAQ